VDEEPGATPGFAKKLITWTIIIILGLFSSILLQGAIDMNYIMLILDVIAKSFQAYLISKLAGTPLS
jgi:hypothetical protein